MIDCFQDGIKGVLSFSCQKLSIIIYRDQSRLNLIDNLKKLSFCGLGKFGYLWRK